MRVLLSCKTTNLDLHGEVIQNKITYGRLAAEHLRTLQEDHRFHHQTRDALLKLLKRRGIAMVEVRRGMYWPEMSDIAAVIALGGDGTLLEASHHIRTSDIPLVGVRSSPMSVGFLCYRSFEGLEEMVEQLATNTLPAVLTQRLQAVVKRADTGFESVSVPVLNDLLYTNHSPAATTRYKLSFNGTAEEHRSSGLWISTPAGSTGAIFAAGGKQVSIRSKDFQFFVRELHRIGDGKNNKLQQGFFDPDTVSLTIENHCMQGLLALDGHQGKVDLGFGDTIAVKRAQPLKLVSELK